MRYPHSARNLAIAVVTALSSVEASFADPLHKWGRDGAYVHEGSGWIFPRSIGPAERVGAPYTIDGNNDVGAEYVIRKDRPETAAIVAVYYADSAAKGASLEGASATMQSESGTGAAAQLTAREPFPLGHLTGTKLTYNSREDSTQSTLYFFQTPQWVVTIRTRLQSGDSAVNEALDEFVRELRWDTLGTDPGDLHGGR